MKFLLLVIDLITNTICIMHTYFDIINISLPQSKFFSPFISYAGVCNVYLFNNFVICWGAIYFRTAKFWESISDYLINCVYVDFARGLYSIDALRPTYTKKRCKEENMVSEKHSFYLGEIKSLRLEWCW